MTKERESKIYAHCGFLLIDAIAIYVMLCGLDDLNRILDAVTAQVDTIKFSNRMGFSMLALVVVSLHGLAIVEFFKPDILKHSYFINRAIVGLTVAFILAGIVWNVRLSAHVENAGYHFCDKATRFGVVSRNLMYTRTPDICEGLVSAKLKQ